MTLPPAQHPIWHVARTGILMAGLCGLLWLNASHFDGTELRTVAEFAAIVFGMDGGLALVRGAKPK